MSWSFFVIKVTIINKYIILTTQELNIQSEEMRMIYVNKVRRSEKFE